MPDDPVSSGLRLTTDIDGLDRVRSFTPPDPDTPSSDTMYWNQQGLTENGRGDDTHAGAVTFSMEVAVDLKNNPLEAWRAEGLTNKGAAARDVNITIEDPEGNAETWVCEGTTLEKLTYSPLTAGDGSVRTVTAHFKALNARRD